MKRTKQTISLFLSVIMIVSTVFFTGITTFAEETDILDSLTYKIDTSGVVITGCDKSISGDVIIPDTIEGYPVTEISANAFAACVNITSVIFSYGIKTVSTQAFSGYSNLENITIPDSVTSIGHNAFANCDKLTQVTIPASVTMLVDTAFSQCNNLIRIDVDNNNPKYSNDEFGVLFNKDKTELIRYPLGNKRTSYVIPESVTSIAELAFYSCESLTNIRVSENNECYSNDEYGVLFNKNQTEVILYPASSNRTIYAFCKRWY